jgi:hypothetical protein
MTDTTQPSTQPTAAPAPAARPQTALAQRAPAPFEPDNLDRAIELATRLSSAGIIPQALVGKPNDILAMVLMGRDMGLSFMQSIQSINIIKGRPSLSAKLKIALVRASPLCEYLRMVESTDEVAVWATQRKGNEPLRMKFTMANAKQANLVHPNQDGSPGMYQKWPALMLRTRCASQLCDLEYGDVLLNMADDAEVAEAEAGSSAGPSGASGAAKPPPVVVHEQVAKDPAPKAKTVDAVPSKPAAPAAAGAPPPKHPDAIDAEFSPADPAAVRAGHVALAEEIKAGLLVSDRAGLEKLLGRIQLLPDDLKSEMRQPYKARLDAIRASEEAAAKGTAEALAEAAKNEAQGPQTGGELDPVGA